MGSMEIFAIINVLLALFVLTFALFSARFIWEDKKKRSAWVLMLALGILLFVTQSLNLLSVAGYVSRAALRPFMDMIFLVVALFTVVFQYSLICSTEKK